MNYLLIIFGIAIVFSLVKKLAKFAVFLAVLGVILYFVADKI